MHKKEKTDAQRAKIFTKIGKEMAVAVKEGGPDPVANSKLAALIAKAKANNVPNDNIDRIIKKASSADSAPFLSRKKWEKERSRGRPSPPPGLLPYPKAAPPVPSKSRWFSAALAWCRHKADRHHAGSAEGLCQRGHCVRTPPC